MAFRMSSVSALDKFLARFLLFLVSVALATTLASLLLDGLICFKCFRAARFNMCAAAFWLSDAAFWISGWLSEALDLLALALAAFLLLALDEANVKSKANNSKASTKFFCILRLQVLVLVLVLVLVCDCVCVWCVCACACAYVRVCASVTAGVL
jgi:hypothetical protein